MLAAKTAPCSYMWPLRSTQPLDVVKRGVSMVSRSIAGRGRPRLPAFYEATPALFSTSFYTQVFPA